MLKRNKSLGQKREIHEGVHESLVGKGDGQASKSGGSYMDVDEGRESQGGSAGGEDKAREEKEDNEDNVTEQTHHIIVPSYRQVPV